MVLGLVFALHIGAVMLLMALPAPKFVAPTISLSALSIRFIESSSKLSIVPEKTASLPKLAKIPKLRLPPVVERVVNATPSPIKKEVIEANWAPSTSAAATYVPGGGLLTMGRDTTMARPDIRLPGGSDIKGAPHFRMVDPQMQGLAGVIHFIGGLTGAVDRHCLDLDAWQGMTTEERIEHHVSEEDMDKIRENYRCEVPHTRQR